MGETASKSLKPASEGATVLTSWQKIRHFFNDARAEMKKNGLKGLFRRYGWKLFAVVFVYYLIRDVTIYIAIPWLVAEHLISK